MYVLRKNPPELDPTDVATSFREITRYLTSTMEDIDFNLNKNIREIGETDSSNTGLQEQINKLRAAVFLLTNSFAGLSNQIDAVKEDVKTISQDIASIDGDIQGIKGDIQTINRSLVSLDGRVTALEQKPQS